jgi:hypothetical protein
MAAMALLLLLLLQNKMEKRTANRHDGDDNHDIVIIMWSKKKDSSMALLSLSLPLYCNKIRMSEVGRQIEKSRRPRHSQSQQI